MYNYYWFYTYFILLASIYGVPYVQGFTTTVDLYVRFPFSSSSSSSYILNHNPKCNPFQSYAKNVAPPFTTHISSTALPSVPLPLEPITTTTATSTLLSSTSYLVRIVFLRAMAFVHFIAYLIAWKQNKALIGDHGITPARTILDAAERRGKEKMQRRLEWRKKNNYTEPSIPLLSIQQREKQILRWMGKQIDSNRRFLRIRELVWDRSDSSDRPLITLLWLVQNRQRLNPWLDGIALTGLSVSVLIMLLGAANVPLVLTVCIHFVSPS